MYRLFLCLLLCGCLPTVTPVERGGTVADMGTRYVAEFRKTCRDAAAKLRAGEWKTDREYLDGHRDLIRKMIPAVGKEFAARQQAEATPFTPDGMADWLEKVAAEGER